MNTDNNVTSVARQMESIKFKNLLINFTTEFQRIWDTNGSGSKPGSFWRPTPSPELLPGFFPLGDIVVPGDGDINEKMVVAVVCEGDPEHEDPSKGNALSKPTDFEQVWKDSGSKAKGDCSVWRPIPPDGYVALGLVCTNGRDRPSLNAVRCVRADLVIASSVGDLIWNDRGSGAKQNFSAWSVSPPTATAGEACFSPGTFIGVGSYIKPATPATAYSLRMQIPLQAPLPLEAPEFSREGLLPPDEPAKVTHVAKLPWFTIRDPDLNPLEQLRTSPFYFMERTDQYDFVGLGQRYDTENRPFKWKAFRAQRREDLQTFARVTSIEMESEWPINLQAPPLIKFSARLNKSFAHAEPSNTWTAPTFVEVIIFASSNQTVALYQMRSSYRLLRENGSQVANFIDYTDVDSLHLTVFPPDEICEVPAAAPAVEVPPVTPEAKEVVTEVTTIPLPVENLPTPTDSAP